MVERIKGENACKVLGVVLGIWQAQCMLALLLIGLTEWPLTASGSEVPVCQLTLLSNFGLRKWLVAVYAPAHAWNIVQ